MASRTGGGLEDRGRPPGLRAGLKDWGSLKDGEGGLKDGGWPQGQGAASRTGGGLEDRGDFEDGCSLKDGGWPRGQRQPRG